jgi:formylglycine-generating enzyme required for sulfatase activity
MRKVEEELAWFDKYLFNTGKPANDAVKKGSSLENLIRKNSTAVQDGAFGILLASKKEKSLKAMVPETVPRGDLNIARFEVTRIQYAESQLMSHPESSRLAELALRKRFTPDGNRPASDITLEQAERYVRWLSQWTGERWRIPYEDEVRNLYEKRDGENTLDYWAGYAPNPEDAAKLREATKKLKGRAPLLKEVGSFHGQGQDDEEPIYDLGGNVAEWVLTRDGKGKLMGGSADCPADAKTDCTPAAEYVGFRVVRGEAKPARGK